MVSRRKDVECHQCGNAQMRLTNLDLEKYTSMSEQDRVSYADAWLYIHNRQKDSKKWQIIEEAKKRRKEKEEQKDCIVCI